MHRSLVLALHRFPHLNATLARVNATFDSRSEVYLGSLGLLGSVPALLLIICLSLLLLYLLTRCCDGDAMGKSGGGGSGAVGCCVRFVLIVVGVVCCSACSLGLYANDDLHTAIAIVGGAVRGVDGYLRHLGGAAGAIEAVLGEGVPINISTVANVFEKPLLNRTAFTELQVGLDYLRRNVSWTLANVQLFADKHFGLIDSNRYLAVFERLRWPATVALQSSFIVLNLLLLYAVGRGSRCSFITFSVLGLLALIANWILVSAYLVAAVALADACTAPARVAAVELPALTGASADLLAYFLRCEGESPLLGEIGFIGGCVEGVRVVLKGLKDDAVKFYDVEKVQPPIESIMDQLHAVDMTLQDLEAADCQQPHAEFGRAVEAACGPGLGGLALLLSAATAAALLFTLAVGFDAHAWIALGRGRGAGGGGRSLNGGGPKAPPSSTSSGGVCYKEDEPLSSRQRGHYHPATLGPNHGQYATLSRGCKTLQANDFY